MKNSYKWLSMLLIASLLTMVGCGEIKKSSLDEINPAQAEHDFWLYKKTSDDRVYKPIKEWAAREFIDTGKLVCRWKQPKQSHPVIDGIKTIGVYPESWGVIDPGTGRIIDKYSDEYHTDGITDGEYVYAPRTGGTSWVHYDFWELASGSIVEDWSMINLPLNWGFELMIVDDCLIQAQVPMPILVTRLDPVNGEKIWVVETTYNAESVNYSRSEKNIFITYNISDNSSEELSTTKNSFVAKINPKNGEVDTLVLPIGSEILILDSIYFEGILWLLTSDVFILEINADTFEFLSSTNVMINDALGTSSYYFDYEGQVCGNSVLFEYKDIEFDLKHLLFNTLTGKVTSTEDMNKLQIINHTLMTTGGTQIKALNPSTLEPTWWINLEEEDLGENPRVIWCDFRGVLVMSDTKLACFTTPGENKPTNN
ncbi:MAG: hypothetical protein KAH30_04935 [Caldisericia bacterium]|nr:hypothetical protein [Caldisericia bacterium]